MRKKVMWERGMGGVGGVSKTLDTSIYRTRFGSQAALYCALPARVCASTALSQATVALAGGRGAGRSSIERRPFTHTGKTSSQPPHCDERTAVLPAASGGGGAGGSSIGRRPFTHTNLHVPPTPPFPFIPNPLLPTPSLRRARPPTYTLATSHVHQVANS